MTRERWPLWKKRPELFEEMRTRYREASLGIPEVKPTGGIPRHETP
jgi:hypothetical protein